MKLKLPSNYRDVVDELGAVQNKLARIDSARKPFSEREKELRTKALTWCEKLPADAEAGIEGTYYSLAVSGRRNERQIVSMVKLFNRLGLALFLKGCSIPLKYIDEQLAAVDQKGLITEARTGVRVITTSPRIQIAAGKKAA